MGEPSARAVIDLLKFESVRAAALVSAMDAVMPDILKEVNKIGDNHGAELALGFASSVASTIARHVAACVDGHPDQMVESIIEILRDDVGITVPADKADR
jgi:L-fucose mutarotase/ribose pyranase (RbsD/FucU family)